MSRVRDLQQRFDDLIPIRGPSRGLLVSETSECRSAPSTAEFSARVKCEDRPRWLSSRHHPRQDRPAPYEDEFDEIRGRFTYRFRDAASATPAAARQAEADNRALDVSPRRRCPSHLLPGYRARPVQRRRSSLRDVGVTEQRLVEFEAERFPSADTGVAGLVSEEDIRRYATREALYRLHQHRFRAAVLRAYRTTLCRVQPARVSAAPGGAHRVAIGTRGGAATVVNGLSLCAIHHLAYDRNLLGDRPRRGGTHRLAPPGGI